MRYLKNLLVGVLILLLFSSLASAEEGVRIKLNDYELFNMDVPPQIVNDRTLVPLRVIFESLGVEPQWNGSERTITAKKGKTSIKLKLDSTIAELNGKTTHLDQPAIVIKGRTMVPVRFIAESLDQNVDWIKESKTVTINAKPQNLVKQGSLSFDKATGTIISCDYQGDDTAATVDIPSVIEGVEVTNIGPGSFHEKHVKDIVIPDTVTMIGNSAFGSNILNTVKIPNGVKVIGDYAFYLAGLSSVDIPDSVERIGIRAFSLCGIKDLKLSSNLQVLEEGVFSNNQITSVEIPSSVLKIKKYAFQINNLKSVGISKDALIEKDAFDDTVKIIRN